jgi:hypothetical protein
MMVVRLVEVAMGEGIALAARRRGGEEGAVGGVCEDGADVGIRDMLPASCERRELEARGGASRVLGWKGEMERQKGLSCRPIV